MTEGNFVPGFVEGILGMRAGETKEVAATFPDPYTNPDLAGKAAVFTITVHDVKERELPPLDDEFAARVSSTKTVEELRAEVKRRLDETVKANARRRMSSELLDKVASANEVPLPAVLVEREIDSLIGDTQQYIARAGLSWDDYLTQAGKSDAEVRENYREEAERRVKTTLLIEAIAKKEGIVATQADVEGELNALAAQYGQPRERIIEALQSNVGALVDGIVRTKTIERLIEQAKRVPATEAASA
jgi:trigger factor